MRQVVARTVCVGYRIRKIKCTVVLLTVVMCRHLPVFKCSVSIRHLRSYL